VAVRWLVLPTESIFFHEEENVAVPIISSDIESSVSRYPQELFPTCTIGEGYWLALS
jgi:hypothetical protein